MKRFLVWLTLVFAIPSLSGSELVGLLPEIKKSSRGFVAFCRPSVVDELQVIGEPRLLSEAEAKELASIFGSEETYYRRSPTGSLIAGRSLCLPHWDFKIILADSEASRVVTARLCSDCSIISLQVDGRSIEAPTLLPPAMKKLTALFDIWFPGWAEASRQNREEKKGPIQAAQPTPGS